MNKTYRRSRVTIAQLREMLAKINAVQPGATLEMAYGRFGMINHNGCRVAGLTDKRECLQEMSDYYGKITAVKE